MDKEKRKLIIAEIEHWRRSKLLPEQYCDFLMNLYLEDPQERTKTTWFGVSASAIQNSGMKIWLLLFGGLGLVSYFVLHFNSFPLPMQIAISSLFILTCYMLGGVQRSKSPLVSYICNGIASFSLLSIGLVLLEAHGAGEGTVIAFVGACSIVWMLVGIWMRLPVFHFGGWVVLCLIYGWFLKQNISSFDWVALQMSWVPVSIVLAWLGWLIQYRSKASGTVLLVVGFCLWFAPEGFGFGFTELNREILQLLLFGKLIFAGALLFASRKKWTEWVA